jgi:hypothetical protein
MDTEAPAQGDPMTFPLPAPARPLLVSSLGRALGVLLTVTTLVTWAGGAEARERPRPERRASLVWVLGQTKVELEKKTLDVLGPDLVEMLIDIVNTPREAPHVRVRALAGLGFYPSEGTYGYLTSLLRERSLMNDDLGTRMRQQAIRSLGAAFGDRAVDEMLGLKQDPELLVREAVALALRDAGSPRVLPALEAWLAVEPAFTVKVAIDKAITRLQSLNTDN